LKKLILFSFSRKRSSNPLQIPIPNQIRDPDLLAPRMSSSDPHTGGSLSDMAVDGTSMPNDAGKMNLIPSVPRPDQLADESDPNNFGASDLDSAATNPSDIPRTTRDQAPNEVLTGTGDALPSSVGGKRLHPTTEGKVTNPDAKGSLRYEKHIKQKGGDQEFGASEGPEAEPAPGEEDLSREEVMDRREEKEV